ncbi:hypothetical protein FJT64_015742 [Amphibalanus amphitrite]|uniref:Retrotransposon gag domain-containing protein n=1 Tax=Amphibalanus amphitrite TaxID=1232801 RepID=A0A6A4XF05_AMPAM|nr:hypothetical protein FJT64_015742 [Amphibalanus amphitrite]
MATGVDAALAKAGRVCDLGTDPSQFLDRFEEWYEEHKLLADSISGITEDQKLNLLLLWGGREFRKFAKGAGVVHEDGDETPKDSLKTAHLKIRASCAQHVNLTMAMYKLMHVKQGTKSVTEFAQEVDSLAQKCQLDTVIKVLGTQITASRGQKTITRDAQRLKKVCLDPSDATRYRKQRYPMDHRTGDEHWPDLHDPVSGDAVARPPEPGQSVTGATGALTSDSADADGAGHRTEAGADESTAAGEGCVGQYIDRQI